MGRLRFRHRMKVARGAQRADRSRASRRGFPDHPKRRRRLDVPNVRVFFRPAMWEAAIRTSVLALSQMAKALRAAQSRRLQIEVQVRACLSPVHKLAGSLSY